MNDFLTVSNLSHCARLLLFGLAISLSLMSTELWAADPVVVSGSKDFADIYGRLVGWIKGDLGRTLSIASP